MEQSDTEDKIPVLKVVYCAIGSVVPKIVGEDEAKMARRLKVIASTPN